MNETDVAGEAWYVAPASEPDAAGNFKSWQMVKYADGKDHFFGGFWDNAEDARAEAAVLNQLEEKAQKLAQQLAQALHERDAAWAEHKIVHDKLRLTEERLAEAERK